MSAPAGQSCTNCLFCVQVGTAVGECRFNAPVYLQQPPIVALSFWCGKWSVQPVAP